MHLHQPRELARGKLVLRTQGFEEGLVEELGGGDTDSGAAHGELGLEVHVQLDLGEGAVCGEASVVAEVAEVVEVLVRVLDGDLYAGGIGEDGGDGGLVEVAPVAPALEGGENEKLGDAGAVGQGGERDRVGWGKGE